MLRVKIKLWKILFAFASSSRRNTQHNLKCIPWVVVIVIFIISPSSWSSSWLPSPSPSPWSSSSSSPSSSSSSSSASSPVEARQGMFRYSDNHSPSPFSITFYIWCTTVLVRDTEVIFISLYFPSRDGALNEILASGCLPSGWCWHPYHTGQESGSL